MCNEALGKLHFWLFVIGFHLTFDFMHVPGLLGMPRRIYTYEPGRGWDIWNLIVTIGVVFQAAGILVFAANIVPCIVNMRLKTCGETRSLCARISCRRMIVASMPPSARNTSPNTIYKDAEALVIHRGYPLVKPNGDRRGRSEVGQNNGITSRHRSVSR
jgi:heme/copper-type cytochrome/quinol oxidase subunit 1